MANEQELAVVLKLVADQFKSELKKSGGMVGEFTSIISDWRTQLAAGATALFALTKSTANLGEEALKTSQRLGLSVEATTALTYAARLADVPVRTLEVSMKSLAQNAAEAARGSGDGAKLFASLGVSATDAAGKVKPLDQLLLEFQDRLNGVTNQAEFVDAGVKAFGKSFLEIVPFIKQGTAVTKEAMEEARRLGVTWSEEDARAAAQFNDELKRLQASMQGLTNSAGKPLLGVMTELLESFRALATNDAVSFFFKGLAEQTVLFTNLVKQAAANVEFLFGKFTFDQLRTEIKRLEAEASAKLLLLENPAARQFINGPKGSSSTSPAAGLSLRDSSADGAYQEKLGKAKGDIFQSQLNGLEIEKKLLDEVYVKWQERAAFFEAMEQREAARQEGVQALREFAEAEFRRDDEMRAQWKAERDREAAIEEEAKGRLLRQQHIEQYEASKTFFDGWAEGMRKYVKDTQSGFGMAADMARRTFQTMEQGASRFFFDVMSGKITSLKDGFRSLLTFAQQIISQIASQLIVNNLAGALTGAGSSLLGKWFGGSSVMAGADAGGLGVGGLRGYASGGAFRVGGFGGTDSQMVAFRASPDETVSVTRPDQRTGGAQVSIVINNMGQNDVQAQAEQGQDGRMMVYITVRDMVKGMISGGEMDKPFRNRFNLSPAVGGRG